MHSRRDKAFIGVTGAIAACVAVAAVIHDKVDFRARSRARAAAITGGDPLRGEAAFTRYGCGGCHGLKDVPKAVGGDGPALDSVALQAVIAGRLSNSPDNLQAWIRHPQQISPGTAMPDLGVNERDARDISAFLYAGPK